MRRIITGTDKNGKSVVLYEGPPQSVHYTTNAHVGSLEITNVPAVVENVQPGEACIVDIWETDGVPMADAPDPMSEPQNFSIEPAGKGLRVRYQIWGPNLNSSTMHATNTLDVNFIVSGQLELLLEEGRSVTLTAGDSVVIPGIQHGWRAGPEGATMLNLMQKLA